MKTALIRLFISCTFLFIIPCCAYLTPSPPPYLPPTCTPEELLRQLREAQGVPNAMRGIAKVKIESPEKKFSTKEIIIAQRPHEVRLETLSPLGHPEFFVVTDGQELSLLSPAENRFYHGPASPKNLSLLVPVTLKSVEEMVSIILGGTPLIDYDPEQVGYRVKGEWCVLKLTTKDGSVRQELKVSLSEQRVVESETSERGKGVILIITYGEYEKVGEMLFPREISIRVPRDKTKVKVSYKKLEFPLEIDPAEFILFPPQGVEVLPLE